MKYAREKSITEESITNLLNEVIWRALYEDSQYHTREMPLVMIMRSAAKICLQVFESLHPKIELVVNSVIVKKYNSDLSKKIEARFDVVLDHSKDSRSGQIRGSFKQSYITIIGYDFLDTVLEQNFLTVNIFVGPAQKIIFSAKSARYEWGDTIDRNFKTDLERSEKEVNRLVWGKR